MRIFVPRDLDGFFGLFIDNLVQLLLIILLCEGQCGMTGEHAYLLYQRILPGAALSILLGNFFYAAQALRVARREKRDDVTALPFGINTPSLLVYVFFVMVPVYQRSKSPELAWQMGLLACLGSGLIEFLGSFVAEQIRRRTPRAALLSTLAGIAIGFISMSFSLQIWSVPLVAMLPMAVVFVTYFAGTRFPWNLPGGLLAVTLGTAIAWILPSAWSGVALSADAVTAAAQARRFTPPVWCGDMLWQVLRSPADWIGFLSVIIPMGLFNVVGSLQNVESAAAAGDHFPTRSSLAANGVGTLLAALLGSCFPTTIYIGHPGWKALGARSGYSILNGVVITLLCLTGTLALVSRIIPIEAGVAIVLWIGIVITAQAFQATPGRHAAAVATGLFPAIAAWGATILHGSFLAAGGRTIQAALEASPLANVDGFLIHGLLIMDRGYIFTCMILAAMVASLIDREFYLASVWAGLGALGSLIGLMHGYQLSGNTLDYLILGQSVAEGALPYRAFSLVLGYLAMALLFLGVGVYHEKTGSQSEVAVPHL